MARTKEAPKPLFSVKHDFYASLDHHLQQGVNLLQAVEMILDLSKSLEPPLAGQLRERAEAFRLSLLTED
jgi:hypothetical protein